MSGARQRRGRPRAASEPTGVILDRELTNAAALVTNVDSGVVVQTVDTPLDVTDTIVGAGVSTCAPYDLI